MGIHNCLQCGTEMTFKTDVGTWAWAYGIGMTGIIKMANTRYPSMAPIKKEWIKGYYMCKNHPERVLLRIERPEFVEADFKPLNLWDMINDHDRVVFHSGG